jgi:hypothetical protein
MKLLREYIRKEIKRLSEEGMKSYPIPWYIKNALENNLKLKPLVRYVATTKAVTSVPPSYRIFFINNQYIDLYVSIEPPFSEKEPGIKAEINHKFYWLHDVREANEAMTELNRVLTQPIPVSGEDEEEGGEEVGGEEVGGEESEMEPEEGGEEEA